MAPNRFENFSRRDFLKLLMLLPALSLDLPISIGKWQTAHGGLNSRQEFPNIIILLFDSLSANHMSLYDYRRDTTPNINAFAETSTVFHSHYSGGNFTTPGTASLLTGTYPWTHRAINYFGTVIDSYRDKNIFNMFDKFHSVAFTRNTFAYLLLNHFRIFLDQLESLDEIDLSGSNVSEFFFSQDFDVSYQAERLIRGFLNPRPLSLFLSIYDNFLRSNSKNEIQIKMKSDFPRGFSDNGFGHLFILEQAVDWIIGQIPRLPKPYLAYFHFWPPHHPYRTRLDFVDMFLDNWAPPLKPKLHFDEGHSNDHLIEERRYYDEFIAYIDSEFGRLLSFLKRTGTLEDTLIVLTSDHGEMFERGIRGHSTPTLYEPVIRIPLLISKPGQSYREDIYSLTSATDMVPTLLNITNQRIPEWCEGYVMPPFMNSNLSSNRSVFVIEAKENPKIGPLKKGTVALIKDKFKLIHYFGYRGYQDQYELYDLENDPEELENLVPSQRSITAELKYELSSKIQEVNSRFGSDHNY
jgi:arylsulfatase A-like enzyme